MIVIPGKVTVHTHFDITGVMNQLIIYTITKKNNINVLFITTLSAQMDTNQ